MTHIEDLEKKIDTEIEAAADELEEEIHEALNPRRKIPWLGIATGLAVAAGVIYLARHRSQRQMLQKGFVRGLEFVGDKIPVRVVMK